jgi:multiple sugar transport system ATP-binding protein
MACVELQDLCKTFRGLKGETVQAVRHLNLLAAECELLVLVGPSGCGKTSTLRLIAGLEEVTAGSVLIGGRPVNDLPPKDRDVAMVFQNHALFPHLSVFENLTLGLMLRRVPKPERERRVRAVGDLLGLADLLARKPAALSGGERQRVALGRAMIRQPGVFLLDEPLSNLDAVLRAQMRIELVRLHRRLEATMVYVTHDQVEALTLGDRIAVMSEGTLQQVAQPQVLYQQPANLFVAGFIGTPPMNFFRGVLRQAGGQLCFQEKAEAGKAFPQPFEVTIPPATATRLAQANLGDVILGVRPEHVVLACSGRAEGSADGLRARVELVETAGAEVNLHLSTGGSRFVARSTTSGTWEVNQTVTVTLDMKQARFFDPASRRLLV